MKKRYLVSSIILLFLLALIVNASALTGRLGNSRMVLRLEIGESAERYLLVENVNDVPLTIELSATGELAENIEFEEENFTLALGEQKKAYFTIKADESGTTETKINVKFTPEEGSGIGLSATVIVIASGEDSNNNDDENDDNNDVDNNSGVNLNFGSSISNGNENSESFKFSSISILLVLGFVLIIVFIALLVYAQKINAKKRARRPGA